MLNSKIRKYLDRKNGSFLITGPPGSGKTHCLIETIKYLITKKEINPSKLLVFCFNRRWAKILRERTTEAVNESIMEIPITTFFSFCSDFLEKYGRDFDLSFNPLKIMNAPEQWKLLKEVINRLEKKNYPLTFKYLSNNSFTSNSYMQEVFDFILRAQENLLSPLELSDKFTPFFNPLLSEITGIFANYKKELYEKKLYNYGRLLEDTVEILKSNDSLKNYNKDFYSYILVDELQEINKAQFEIVNNLAKNNCIFFGNDDESIYAFRGSMSDNFNKVYNSITLDRFLSEDILILDKNYRSTEIINNIGNAFISVNKNRIRKTSQVFIKKTADRQIKAALDGDFSQIDSGGEVIIKEFKNKLDEANFICAKIKYLTDSLKINPEDICIIIKGLGLESHLIETALMQNKITYIRRSSRTILDNKYVMYLISFLRLIWLLGIEQSENGTIEKTEKRNVQINNILENLLVSDVIDLNPLYLKKISLNFDNIWSYMTNLYEEFSQNRGTSKNKEQNKVLDFVLVVNEFLDLKDESVYPFVNRFINNKKIGLIKYLTSQKITDQQKESLLNTIGDFLESIKEFSIKNEGRSSIGEYTNYLDDIVENNFIEEIEEITVDYALKGAVNILSYHHSKGLEFKAVFLPFINKNYLPSIFGLPQLYDLQIFNYFADGKIIPENKLKELHLEDERKLFYTGITRAKKYLYITANKSSEKSVFFEELKDIYEAGSLNNNNRTAFINNYGSLKNKSSAWLVRKKAVVSTFRIAENLKTDISNYLRQLDFLGTFYTSKRWWSFIKKTYNFNNPFILFPAPYSYTSLNSFLDCPFKYKLRHYLKIKEEKNLTLILGSMYHEILKTFFEATGTEKTWKDLEGIIKKIFASNNFDFGYLKKELTEKAIKEFKNYYDNYMPRGTGDSIMEKSFIFRIDEEIFSGRIDQINFIDENTAEIIDFKSGVNNMSGPEFEKEMQLKLYSLAVDLSNDLNFLRKKNLELKFIFLGEGKKPIAVFPEEFYKKESFINLINELVLRIKSENYEPEPENHMSCVECSYRIICPKSRQVN